MRLLDFLLMASVQLFHLKDRILRLLNQKSSAVQHSTVRIQLVLREPYFGPSGAHYGPELREADALHAEKVVQAKLQRRRWTQEDLGRRPKGDAQKVASPSASTTHPA